MVRHLAAAALALSISAGGSPAQQAAPPLSLLPSAPPRSYEPEPLPPIGSDPERAEPANPAGRTEPSPPPPPAAMNAPATESATARNFCHQPVRVRLAERYAVPERYRRFIGMWSDAAWTPLLCAALIVENVTQDGTATITYAFGPMGSTAGGSTAGGSNAGGAGGVLNGTGIVRDGELRFQNSDGSQFAFKPLYSDLDGRLTTPQGQTHRAIFKKTL